MFLSRIQVRPGPQLFELLKKENSTNSYAVHQLLWSLFPNNGEKKRDFLYREDKEGGMPCFYMVSKEVPVENSAMAVTSKPYTPILKSGDQLHFSLLANPVVARKSEGKKNSIKHDVWMDAKKKGKDAGLKGFELVKMCEDAAKSWLISRAEQYGLTASAEDLVIDGYLQHRFFKKRGGKEIKFSTVNYEGILSVNDPDTFITNALFGGVGPSKAFGCGLMLVKKVRIAD